MTKQTELLDLMPFDKYAMYCKVKDAQINRLQEQLTIAREALEFYGSINSYYNSEAYESMIDFDQGKKAKQALSAIKEQS